MGFSGDFVLARSDRPLHALPPLAVESAAGGQPGEGLRPCAPRPGGWQTLRLGEGVMTGSRSAWLRGLVTVTGAPAMVATVFDSDVCQVWGAAPSGASWTAFLDPVLAADYAIPMPGPEEVRAAAGGIAGWAAEAGFTADREALLAVLTRRADPLVEDLFFALVDACGLPPADPEGSAADRPAGAAHPGHQPEESCPRGPGLGAAVRGLPRDGHLVLDCAGDEQCYAQVWLRPDGSYQLEYRDCDPAEHYWTRTASVEQVVTALTGWAEGETAWRNSFQWTPLAPWFTEPTA
ncbi:hypothetical protein [Streptomyces sp. NBC_01190]|uniref:hypothetical protein n=1 Tax=Streptomyces sp. NBC_01190 TaxID=2903767 RepID=UPI0038648443|nr:hypothetical protein OG519_33465 [Streptomyces sp. NBC_01190]